MRLLLLWGTVLAVGCGAGPAAAPTVVAEDEWAGDEASAQDTSVPRADVAEEPEPDESPTAGLVPEENTIAEFELACGRARVVGTGWRLDPEESEPCNNPGYPMQLDGRGFAGGESRHVLSAGGCRIEVYANDSIRTENSSPPNPEDVTTPEGTALMVEVSLHYESRGCAEDDELIAAFREELVGGIRIPPLRDDTTSLHADLTSAGHGLRGELGAGYWMQNLGGMADVFETAYRVLGPDGASATFISAWNVDEMQEHPDFDPRRFQPRVLPRRPRFEPASDPWEDLMGGDGDGELSCRSTLTEGPEPRIDTSVTLCGPLEGQRRLVRMLQGFRFTEPRPR